MIFRRLNTEKTSEFCKMPRKLQPPNISRSDNEQEEKVLGLGLVIFSLRLSAS